MVEHNTAIFIYKGVIALFCALNIGLSPAAHTEKIQPAKRDCFVAVAPRNDESGDLWQYLRKGLNYLEASGKEVKPDFLHPGGEAYGPLALTCAAITDVQAHYPSLGRYKFQDVISDAKTYEMFAMFYAKLLFTRYLKVDYTNIPKEEAFQLLQRAWFLGPTLYLEGYPVIASREAKAIEYLLTVS